MTAVVGPNFTTPKTATANCPAGKLVVGGGLMSGTTNVTLRDNSPVAGNTGWSVTANEQAAGTPNWSLTVYAICVTALP
ncbi:MAG: hypothetical protein R2708_20235 [Vicinamibacterales bacterium]